MRKRQCFFMYEMERFLHRSSKRVIFHDDIIGLSL